MWLNLPDAARGGCRGSGAGRPVGAGSGSLADLLLRLAKASGGRLAAADLDPARLHRLGHDPLQIDRKQAVLERGLSWPHVELGETDKEIRVTAELPGLDENDVELTVEEGVLTLRGEKRAEVADKDRGYSERSYGRFERRIGLPQDVDRDKVTATFKNGILTVALPRTEAANENVRRIPVNGKAA